MIWINFLVIFYLFCYFSCEINSWISRIVLFWLFLDFLDFVWILIIFLILCENG
jgi:hypothetical protein